MAPPPALMIIAGFGVTEEVLVIKRLVLRHLASSRARMKIHAIKSEINQVALTMLS